jgi:F-type H+-transporting ATPase subunit b
MKRIGAKSVPSFAALLIAVAAFAAPAFAADGGPAEAANSPAGLIFRWLNFILVFGALAYVLARWGGPYFRGRGAEISVAIRDAAAAKAEAERELREIEDQVAHIDQEIARVRADAVREEAAEAQRQAESGRREIERIDRAAQFEIESAARAGRLQLRALAAQLAVAEAEKQLRANLPTNEPARAALFQSFLAQLGRMRN